MKKGLIIKGHGGADVGAVSSTFIERDINSKIVDYLYNYIKDYCNIDIEKDNKPLADEVNLVNSSNYDFVISVHNNAGGGDGFEAYYYSSDLDGYNLCLAIEKRVQEIGQNSRGVKVGNGFRIINAVKPTSIILEGFFIDNATDREMFKTDEGLQKLGVAYAKGILDWLGITTKVDQGAKEENVKTYRVITGSFKDVNNANKRVQELKNLGYASFIEYV